MKWNICWMIVPIILSTLACKEPNKQSNYLTISGHIKNASLDSVYVKLNEREKGFALDFDGNFADTVQLNDEGYKTLAIDREEFPVYLIPGDSLHLRVDLNNFEKTFIFDGKGASRNNYLFQKEILVNNWLANEQLYQLSAEEYQANLKDFLFQMKQNLQGNQVDDSFAKIEQKNLYFDEFNMLYAYRDSYAYFNPTKPQLPINFLNFSHFDLDNADDFKQFQSYRSIVAYYLDEQLNQGNAPQDLLRKIKSEPIKYAFLRTLIDQLDPTDASSAIYFKAIQEFCTYQPWLKEAKTKMGE